MLTGQRKKNLVNCFFIKLGNLLGFLLGNMLGIMRSNILMLGNRLGNTLGDMLGNLQGNLYVIKCLAAANKKLAISTLTRFSR